MEVTLVIPVVSWGWRRDEGEEEERIRTEEQVVREKEEPRGQIFVCISRCSLQRYLPGSAVSRHSHTRMHACTQREGERERGREREREGGR